MAFWELGQTIWVNIKTKVCCFGVLWVLLWYRLRFHMIISMFSTFQYSHISMLTLSDHRQKNPSEILRRRKGVELQSLDVRFVFFFNHRLDKDFLPESTWVAVQQISRSFFFYCKDGACSKTIKCTVEQLSKKMVFMDHFWDDSIIIPTPWSLIGLQYNIELRGVGWLMARSNCCMVSGVYTRNHSRLLLLFSANIWMLQVSFLQVQLLKIVEIWSSGWWFQTFCIFNPTCGNDPFWLICFKWVETTN